MLGQYIVDHGATVRSTAAAFGFSKSLVHKDVTERLSRLSPELWESVHAVLMKNRDERHLRGGEATAGKIQPSPGQSDVTALCFSVRTGIMSLVKGKDTSVTPQGGTQL